MHKRRFLQAVACATPLATTLPMAHAAQPATQAPALLTVTGQVGKPNRGPLDKVVDQMMGKHGIAFDKARALTFADVLALPATEIRPTVEYDGKRVTYASDAEMAAALGDLNRQITGTTARIAVVRIQSSKGL